MLGLYGDEAGATRLCREHAHIQTLIKAHPAEDFSAIDLTGLRCFRIENLQPPAPKNGKVPPKV